MICEWWVCNQCAKHLENGLALLGIPRPLLARL